MLEHGFELRAAERQRDQAVAERLGGIGVGVRDGAFRAARD